MNLAKLDADFVAISDIHLTHLEDDRGKLLLDVLSHLSEKVQCLVLNGDIFDFCFGDSVFFKAKFAPLGRQLARLAERGTDVVFLEGNHEFAIDKLGWKKVQVLAHHETTITLKGGSKLAIAHGDLLLDDPWYQRFRGLLKSEAMLKLARNVPGKWLDAYALKHARVSRSRDKYRVLDHDKVIKSAFNWLAASGAKTGIFGHFHVPYSEKAKVSGESYQILSVESWDRPNLLIMNNGDFFRAYPRNWRQSGMWEFQHLKSVFS
jgi:UDP-2,3-diacylglucosamine hydrolase